jgi:hypothetical protein
VGEIDGLSEGKIRSPKPENRKKAGDNYIRRRKNEDSIKPTDSTGNNE